VKILIYTSVISPHLLPFAMALASRIGEENLHYVYSKPLREERKKLGWADFEVPKWVVSFLRSEDRPFICKLIQEADVLLITLPEKWVIDVFLRRSKPVLYMSERWLKPPIGVLRLCHPWFLIKSMRFRKWIQHPKFWYLPIGIHAACDIIRVNGAVSLRLWNLFWPPAVKAEEQAPLSKICVQTAFKSLGKAVCDSDRLSENMMLWGYFVEHSHAVREKDARVSRYKICNPIDSNRIRLVWCGRMLAWKRVGTIIEAVSLLEEKGCNIELHLVGSGTEKGPLKALSADLLKKSRVVFHGAVSLAKVREHLRVADIFVLPSSGYEGWGAVVNEAMSEGCCVIVTHEAGAASMIRTGENGLLFHSGNTNELADLLFSLIKQPVMIRKMGNQAAIDVRDMWSAGAAAGRIIDFLNEVLHDNAAKPCRT
jgi:glycosyltransferase involved in cell wall biosynthesis